VLFGTFFVLLERQRVGETMAGDKIKIVVVDDDELIRMLVVDMLEPITNAISSFENAALAWNHIRKNRTDVIISDVNMSGMGGLKLLKNVKGELGDVKCIIMSGDPSNEKLAYELRADAFMRKPFLQGDLFETLDRLL